LQLADNPTKNIEARRKQCVQHRSTMSEKIDEEAAILHFYFFRISTFFLEMTTFFLMSRWNILCPIQSEVSYFGRMYVPIIKTFLLLSIDQRFEGVEAQEGHEKVPARHTGFFLKIT
jgi:hypothetical protein